MTANGVRTLEEKALVGATRTKQKGSNGTFKSGKIGTNFADISGGP